jgi:hypothetical protein
VEDVFVDRVDKIRRQERREETGCQRRRFHGCDDDNAFSRCLLVLVFYAAGVDQRRCRWAGQS